MRFLFALIIIFSFGILSTNAQFLIPGEGIMDAKIGADWDEIEWELGFKGFKIDKADVPQNLDFIAKKAGVDYDFVISYQHIMWLPVSELFFKDDRVCLVQLSSYPDYYKMLCVDIGTVEGLNFWENPERVREIYGDVQGLKNDENSYFIYAKKGIGVEISENEVRTMFIFQPQMK